MIDETKDEFEEAAAEVELLSDMASLDGLEEVFQGLDDLELAEDV